MTKHTPGPWTIGATIGQTRHIHAAGDERSIFASVYGHNRNNVAADAQLIAAAPDLLLIAHAAYHALESYAHGNASPELAESIAAALALTIAKAEGD